MPRAVRETFPFGLCGSDELVWYGEGESMTSMSPVGQERTVEYLLLSGQSIRIVITYVDQRAWPTGNLSL
jgi:hypothetical protein